MSVSFYFVRKLDVKGSLFLLNAQYKEEFGEYDRIKTIFATPAKGSRNFTKVEGIFLSLTTMEQIQKFRDFKVADIDEHKEALRTIQICLSYFSMLKALHLFSSSKQLNKPNRQNNLKIFVKFFSNFIIDRSNTRNESFLVETLQDHLKLEIDVVTVQTGIFITYALGRCFTLANCRNYEDVKMFDIITDNTILMNLNHPYVFHFLVSFMPPINSKSFEM